MNGTNNSEFQGFNAPEILAKLDAIEKACKNLRKVVLDSVNYSGTLKPSETLNLPKASRETIASPNLALAQSRPKGSPEGMRQHKDAKHKPSKKFEYNDSTFLYECMDETRNQRLTALYVGLKQLNLIDQRTPQKQFIDLFSGEPLYHRIKWTGGKAQLAYLFKQLIKQKKYVTTPGSRIWLTVRSHFVQVSGQPFDEDIKAQQMPGEKPVANLDFLIELLNPGKTLPSVRPSRRD